MKQSRLILPKNRQIRFERMSSRVDDSSKNESLNEIILEKPEPEDNCEGSDSAVQQRINCASNDHHDESCFDFSRKVAELNSLHNILFLRDKANVSLSQFFSTLVESLGQYFDDNELSGIRILYKNVEFQSPEFNLTDHKAEVQITDNQGSEQGVVEIYYLPGSEKSVSEDDTQSSYHEIASLVAKEIRHFMASKSEDEGDSRDACDSRRVVRSLELFRRLALLTVDQKLPDRQLLQWLVENIPPSWNCSDLATCRIVRNGLEYRSPGYSECDHRWRVNLSDGSSAEGFIEVYCHSFQKSCEVCNYYEQKQKILVDIARLVSSHLRRLEDSSLVSHSEELHRLTLANLDESVYVTDEKGHFLYLNSDIDRIFGYTVYELKELANIHRIFGHENIDLNRLKAGEKIVNQSMKVNDKYNHEKTVLLSARPVDFKGGRLLFSCRDITEYKSHMDDFERLAEMTGFNGQPFLEIDRSARLTKLNENACKLLERDKKEVIGKHYETLFDSLTRQKLRQLTARLKQGESVAKYQISTATSSGDQIRLFIYAVPHIDRDGNFTGAGLLLVEKTHECTCQKSLKDLSLDPEDEESLVRGILNQLEHEKKSQQNYIRSNLEKLVFPILTILQKKVGNEENKLLCLLKSCLSDLNSPLASRLESSMARLSPREINVCELIKNGLSSKEIAQALNISLVTVHKFRQRIRKKLQLTNKAVSLFAFLKNMDEEKSK